MPFDPTRGQEAESQYGRDRPARLGLPSAPLISKRGRERIGERGGRTHLLFGLPCATFIAKAWPAACKAQNGPSSPQPHAIGSGRPAAQFSLAQLHLPPTHLRATVQQLSRTAANSSRSPPRPPATTAALPPSAIVRRNMQGQVPCRPQQRPSLPQRLLPPPPRPVQILVPRL